LACRVSLERGHPPAAIDIAPQTSPATPTIKTSLGVAATPTLKLAVETMPSSSAGEDDSCLPLEAASSSEMP
jgi:hypothetical protein